MREILSSIIDPSMSQPNLKNIISDARLFRSSKFARETFLNFEMRQASGKIKSTLYTTCSICEWIDWASYKALPVLMGSSLEIKEMILETLKSESESI